jgi:KAP family P-loop domain
MESSMSAVETKLGPEQSSATETSDAKIRRPRAPRSVPSYETETAQPREKPVADWDTANWDRASWADDQESPPMARAEAEAARGGIKEKGARASHAGYLTVRPQAISDEAVGDLSRDSLGFRPYVDALARFLRASETQPPLAIAVRAPWGRGKTSFMKMIDHELQRTSSRSLRFATTWFNPWKYSTRDELWAAYLAAVTACLRDSLGPRRRLWFAARRFWIGLSEQGQRTAFFWHVAILGSFLFLSGLIAVSLNVGTLTTELVKVVFGESLANAIGPALGGTLAWLAAGVPAAAYVMQRFNLDLIQYLQTAAAPRSIASLRQFEGQLQLLAESKPDHLKVVVFVDDLDRCGLRSCGKWWSHSSSRWSRASAFSSSGWTSTLWPVH